MARPLIDFLQVQNMPWTPGLPGSGRDDVFSRLLSRDARTGGGVTALVQYPPGWNRATPEHLTVDEEFYVLSGSIDVDGLHYRPDTYAYLPAGLTRRQAASDQGAVLLSFFSGEPRAVAGAGGRVDRAKWQGRIDPYLAIWEPGAQGLAVDAELKTGARVKPLRRDSIGGAQTFLVGFVALWRDARRLRAAHDIEAYLLSGDCALAGRGVMRSGAYVSRPAGSEFGPMGSLTPSVFLVRTSGGPYRVDDLGRAAVDLAPAWAPVLPPDLRSYDREPPPPAPAW
ncbi:MAG: hypothetical protein EXQ85_04005 [Alphaproteobacteria bacterium]|nr:hypothetical protein [Alphaproteobacteria bacterium]